MDFKQFKLWLERRPRTTGTARGESKKNTFILQVAGEVCTVEAVLLAASEAPLLGETCLTRPRQTR